MQFSIVIVIYNKFLRFVRPSNRKISMPVRYKQETEEMEVTLRFDKAASNSALRVMLNRSHETIDSTLAEAIMLQDALITASQKGGQIIYRSKDGDQILDFEDSISSLTRN